MNRPALIAIVLALCTALALNGAVAAKDHPAPAGRPSGSGDGQQDERGRRPGPNGSHHGWARSPLHHLALDRTLDPRENGVNATNGGPAAPAPRVVITAAAPPTGG